MLNLNTKKYIWVIAVIVLLIFLHFTRILSPVETAIVKIFNPILSGLYSASSYIKTSYNKQTDKRDLVNLVKQLEESAVSLTTENARLKALDEENKVLREYLRFLKESDLSLVLANVITRKGLFSSDLDQNIIIDKGSRDGVEVGLGVISKDTIIGKVIGVKNNLSEVCLLTSRDCKLAATIQNKDKTSGIIMGELGLTIEMEFIPQTEEVKAGDTVITSGLEETIPRNLVIGKITEVNKESNELWQSATIEPLADMDELIIVSVLIP